jgi:hypothetical protein
MRQLLLLLLSLVGSVFMIVTPAFSAQPLPTYEDFRRVDRMRRMTGQLQTAELMRLTDIDRGLIQRVVQQATNDYQIVWGAAELIRDWPSKRALFDAALTASDTNMEVALRYACAAAEAQDTETATTLLHLVEVDDSANIVPWFVEMELLAAEKKGLADMKSPPSWAIRFRDYAADAAKARIHTLEAMGYSPYAARRLGFMPDTPVLAMVRDCAEKPIDKAVMPLLATVARAMQGRPIYLVTELVGQTLERAVMKVGVEGQTGSEASFRNVELDRRRDDIRVLLSMVEQTAVDVATESEMVQYFDNVLSLGEEIAMRRLVETVQGGHPSP